MGPKQHDYGRIASHSASYTIRLGYSPFSLYRFPSHRITVNLSPADIKKEGAGFDLPMAAGILAAAGLLNHDKLKGYLLTGELSLDGKVSGGFRVSLFLY